MAHAIGRRLESALKPNRFCLMISEEVPATWECSIPLALETLEGVHEA